MAIGLCSFRTKSAIFQLSTHVDGWGITGRFLDDFMIGDLAQRNALTRVMSEVNKYRYICVDCARFHRLRSWRRRFICDDHGVKYILAIDFVSRTLEVSPALTQVLGNKKPLETMLRDYVYSCPRLRGWRVSVVEVPFQRRGALQAAEPVSV